MNTDETLAALIPLFENYYNVNTENVREPFVAEAVFESHNEQYYLIKAAKVANIDMNEYVYFAKCDELGADDFRVFDETAGERGLANVTPSYDHRSTDVTLLIIADRIDSNIRKRIKRTRRYKSYKWGFNGWSNYRLVAIECSTGKAVYNRHGRSLEKLVGNILR